MSTPRLGTALRSVAIVVVVLGVLAIPAPAAGLASPRRTAILAAVAAYRGRAPGAAPRVGEVIRGIHHLGLTVRDVDASAAWYARVLGFRLDGRYESPDRARRKVFLRHDGFGVRIGLTQHRDGVQDPFDETHVGLDHLAFTVSNRDELESWADRLASAGIVHSPPAPANSIPEGFVLVFRDPDNIQLELVAEGEPADPASP